MTNAIALETTDATVIAALDSLAQNGLAHLATRRLMIGLPCTIGIGSDSYAAMVVKTTACTITAEYVGTGGLAGEQVTFRKTGDSYTYKRHHYLTLGEARHRMDPCF